MALQQGSDFSSRSIYWTVLWDRIPGCFFFCLGLCFKSGFSSDPEITECVCFYVLKKHRLNFKDISIAMLFGKDLCFWEAVHNSSLANSHFAASGFNFKFGRRWGFFSPVPKRNEPPVWLSCFSLLLFSSAFPQITAEPVDQFPSSLTKRGSCKRHEV